MSITTTVASISLGVSLIKPIVVTVTTIFQATEITTTIITMKQL